MTKRTLSFLIIPIAVVAVILVLLNIRRLRQPVAIAGGVVESNADTKKQRPIEGAVITASDGVQSVTTRSDPSGYFKLVLKKQLLSGKPILLSLRHPDYEPLNLDVPTGRLRTRNQLYIEKMLPIARQAPAGPHGVQAVVSEVRVRYTINARRETDVGSAARIFQVDNLPNVPCDRRTLCSPDGKWKAASGSASLDAGADNVFNNIRTSCIAGPCPFTRIDSAKSLNGERTVQISALAWSEPATFLVEAEVIHAEITSDVRKLYPVIFGRGLNFTMPPTAEGVSVEAEIGGTPMVFPLSPDLQMSWATCTVQTGAAPEKIAVYRCELTPGYRF